MRGEEQLVLHYKKFRHFGVWRLYIDHNLRHQAGISRDRGFDRLGQARNGSIGPFVVSERLALSGHEANQETLKRLNLEQCLHFDANAVAYQHQAHLAKASRPGDYIIEGVQIHCPRGVYHPDPASSTTFFLRHLLARQERPGLSILDVGVGSGALLLTMARRFKPKVCVGVDICELAVDCAQGNALYSRIDARIYQSDLFSEIASDRFDVIFFNPPLYDKPLSCDIEEAMCDPGGKLLTRFVKELPNHLTPDGAAYIVVSNIGNLEALAAEWLSINLVGAEIFASRMMRAVIQVRLV